MNTFILNGQTDITSYEKHLFRNWVTGSYYVDLGYCSYPLKAGDTLAITARGGGTTYNVGFIFN